MIAGRSVYRVVAGAPARLGAEHLETKLGLSASTEVATVRGAIKRGVVKMTKPRMTEEQREELMSRSTVAPGWEKGPWSHEKQEQARDIRSLRIVYASGGPGKASQGHNGKKKCPHNGDVA